MSYPTPTLNIPLLRKVVEWVEEQETLTYDQDGREWDQGVWFRQIEDRNGWCQTLCCVAGKTALIEGWKPDFGPFDSIMTSFVERGGERAEVSDVAAKALGLTTSEANDLFRGFNGPDSVRLIAERIAGERL